MTFQHLNQAPLNSSCLRFLTKQPSIAFFCNLSCYSPKHQVPLVTFSDCPLFKRFLFRNNNILHIFFFSLPGCAFAHTQPLSLCISPQWCCMCVCVSVCLYLGRLVAFNSFYYRRKLKQFLPLCEE